MGKLLKNSQGDLYGIYNDKPLLCKVDECYDLFYNNLMNKRECYQLNYKSCLELKETGGK